MSSSKLPLNRKNIDEKENKEKENPKEKDTSKDSFFNKIGSVFSSNLNANIEEDKTEMFETESSSSVFSTSKEAAVSQDERFFNSDPIIQKREEKFIPEIKKLEANSINLEIDPDTTYFFIFGEPEAGKSVLISGLLYYLKAFAKGQLRSISSADKNNHIIGDYIAAEMIKYVKKGKWVPRTRNLADQELSTELNFEFQPQDTRIPNFPFCILENSGEDLMKIRLKNFGKDGGILDERINAYLKHPDCSMIFICTIDIDEADKSEDLIDSFLDYAHKYGHQNNPVLFTINKWDKISNQYENGEHFLKQNTPILYKKLFDTNRSFAFMPFSIGEMINPEEYRYKPNDAKKLFDWMYEKGIGVSLNDEIQASKLDSLFSSFKNMFKK